MPLTLQHAVQLGCFSASIVLSCANVVAQETSSEPAASSSTSPSTSAVKDDRRLWELGISGASLSQQAYPGSDVNVNKILVIPLFLYRGEHFRVDRSETGFRAVKSPTFEFDIGFSGSFGAKSDKIEARKGMEVLGNLIEFGPRLKWNLSPAEQNGKWRLEFPLRGVFDVSHQFKNRGLTFEPELKFERTAAAGWRYVNSLSVVLGNQQMADSFYTVLPSQATSQRPAYQAQKGLIMWRASTFISYAINQDLRAFGGVRIDTVSGAANEASSLIKKKTAASFFLGMTYTWQRSDRRAYE